VCVSRAPKTPVSMTTGLRNCGSCAEDRRQEQAVLEAPDQGHRPPLRRSRAPDRALHHQPGRRPVHHPRRQRRRTVSQRARRPGHDRRIDSERRSPCHFPSRRIRPTSGRCHQGQAPITADPEPRPAHVAGTASARTTTPVPAQPAAVGGGAVSAAATPGSIRPARPDKPGTRPARPRPPGRDRPARLRQASHLGMQGSTGAAGRLYSRWYLALRNSAFALRPVVPEFVTMWCPLSRPQPHGRSRARIGPLIGPGSSANAPQTTRTRDPLLRFRRSFPADRSPALAQVSRVPGLPPMTERDPGFPVVLARTWHACAADDH
jgi:hypothetical protein